MRESIGSVFLYNIVIIFIIIVFAIISATISYYKAFKVNERIAASIEKFEGFNDLSRNEIEDYLYSIGYTTSDEASSVCPDEKDGATLVTPTSTEHLYCIYFFGDDTGEQEDHAENGDEQPIYYNYSIITYIYVDLPIAGSFKVPVYSKAERIYNFSDGDNDMYKG